MIDFDKYCKPVLKQGAEYADLRILSMNSEAYSAKDNTLSSIQSGTFLNFGVRVFYKGAWGFSFASDMDSMKDAFIKAGKMAKINAKKVNHRFRLNNTSKAKENVKQQAKVDPAVIDVEEKVREVLEFNKLLKGSDVKSRTTDIAFSSSNSRFFNSTGAEISEPRCAFGLRMNVTGKSRTGLVNSFERMGKTGGYELFKALDKNALCSNLHKKLIRALKSRQAPGGRFPVVIDNDLCGVFFHEAVGHACEADAVLSKSSVFQERLGKRVAPEFITLIDTPNVNNEGGYFKYDDEGIHSSDTVMIDKGVLTTFINSLETASMMGVEPTGNGRAQNPMNFPIPRMTNTVLMPGPYDKDDLFKGIKKGVYAIGSSGGVVEPINGNFVFNAGEAYMIENGEITTPLRDVSLAGNILEILPNIEKVANDEKPNFFGGRCGKKGQLVPVGEKTPHIKISEAMVGGGNS